MLQRFTQVKNPRSYQPGVLLNHIANDLSNVDTILLDNELKIRPQDGPEFRVIESVKRNFLQHICIANFILNLPWSVGNEDIHISFSHSGHIKRKGLKGKVMSGAEQANELEKQVTQSDELIEAILPLDFTDFEILVIEDKVQAQMKLYGGSEVVSQFPSFRRYVRLDAEQQQALVNSFRVLNKMTINLD